MARRKRVDRDNPERWLISYADFITLLFAFFVVMYAISSVNEGKYKVFSLSLNNAFGEKAQGVEGGDVHLSEQEMYFKAIIDRRNARLTEQQLKQNESMQLLFTQLTEAMASFVQSGQMVITKSNHGVVLDINASTLFKAGEASLQTDAQKMLAEVAALLETGEQRIEVQGHTDNIPIKTATFPSNWELSSARASSVVRLFIEQGIASTRLTASGAADNQPVLSNDTPEGRNRNRRVTITVLNETQTAPKSPATPAQ